MVNNLLIRIVGHAAGCELRFLGYDMCSVCSPCCDLDNPAIDRRFGAAVPAPRDDDPSPGLFNLIAPIAVMAERCAARTAQSVVRRRIGGDFILGLLLWIGGITVVALLRLLFGRGSNQVPPIQQYQASPPITNRSGQ
jgi:hypothetical protein